MILPFLEHRPPIVPTPSYIWEKTDPSLFGRIWKTQPPTHPYPLYKGGEGFHPCIYGIENVWFQTFLVKHM